MLDTSGYTPILKIEKDDIDITANFEDRLISMTIESVQGNGQGDRLTLILDDRDWIIESPNSAGGSETTLSLSLGFKETGLYDMGTFRVTEVVYEGMPKKLEITAISNGFSNAAKSPVILSHEDTTLGQVAQKIADAAGVSLSISQGLSQRTIPYLNQHESSFHLLQKLERDNNALAKFEDGYLSITDRGSGKSATDQAMSGFVLGPEDLAEWSIRENNRTSHSKVRSSYFDTTTYETKWVTSTAQGDGQQPFMIKRPYASKSEAQNGADAKMAALNRATRSGNITLVKGNPGIKGGQTPFTIANCREGMDGDYIISTATHTLTKSSGLTTSFDFHNSDAGAITGSTASEESPDVKSTGSDVDTSRNINNGAIGHPV